MKVKTLQCIPNRIKDKSLTMDLQGLQELSISSVLSCTLTAFKINTRDTQNFQFLKYNTVLI